MSKVTLKNGKNIGQHIDPPKRMGWRYFLIWFAGFLSAGLIVGIVAIVLSTSFSTREIISMFGGDPNAILQPYYQDLSIIRTITDVASRKYETLGDIYQITPMVKTMFDEYVNPVLEKELHYKYPWEEISIKPFKTPAEPRSDGSIDPSEDLPTYLGRAIKEGVYLANFITGDHPNLMNIFLYPKDSSDNFDYDHPYSLMDFIDADSTFFNNIINSIKVKDVTGTTGVPLIDDEDGIGNWGLNEFTDTKINSLPLSLLLDPDSVNPLIVKLRDNWTVGDLRDEDNFKNLLLSEVITIDSSSPKMLQKLAELGYTIGQLESTNLYNVLKVEDVFDVGEEGLLAALGGFYLSDLEDDDTILGLYVGDIFPPKEGRDSIVDKFADKTLSELSTMDVNDIKLSDIFSEADINASKILKALIATDSEITIGDITDPSTIQSLKIQDILSDEQIASNNLLDAIKGHTIGAIPSEINNIKLGKILGIDVGDPDTSQLLKSLAEETITTLPNFIDNITLGDVMDFSSYPNLDNDDVKGAKINDLNSLINKLKNHLKLKDVVDIDASSPWILRQLKDKYLYELDDEISNFKLGDFIEIDSSSPLVLQNLATVALDDLEDSMTALTLNQIVPVTSSSPVIIQSLANVTVLDGTSLVSKLNSLKLNEIYKEEDCTGIFGFIWRNTGGGDVLITDIPNEVNNLPLVMVLEEYIYNNDISKAKYYDAVTGNYYSSSELVDGKSPDGNPVTEYKRINPSWWFLFTAEGEEFTADEKYYVLKEGLTYTVGSGMDDIVDNFTYHMKTEPIQALYDAGLLEIEAGKEYYLQIIVTYKGESRKVGSLTMSEFLDFCMANITL